MKTIAILIIMLSAFMQPAFAEKGNRGDHSERRAKHMERMIEELQLNSEQEPAVRQILEEQHSKMLSERQAVHEQMRPKMEALKAETGQRLSTVLTDEQLQSFNAQMEKHQQKRRDRKSRWRNKEDK
jgi:C-terminal processing protease CtpA/Prc